MEKIAYREDEGDLLAEGVARAHDELGVEDWMASLHSWRRRRVTTQSSTRGVVCKFSSDFVTEERLEKLLDADYDNLLEIGARIVELECHFNNQRGFDRADDTLPYDLPNFEQALDEYYEVRGWNDDGTVPDGRISGGEGAASADD